MFAAEEIHHAKQQLAKKHNRFLKYLERAGKQTFMSPNAYVYAHKPDRDANGDPLGMFRADNWERQDRLCIAADGCTMVEFEIIYNKDLDEYFYKVLSNKTRLMRWYEDRAWNHAMFNVGNLVNESTIRKYFRFYLKCIECRMLFYLNPDGTTWKPQKHTSSLQFKPRA